MTFLVIILAVFFCEGEGVLLHERGLCLDACRVDSLELHVMGCISPTTPPTQILHHSFFGLFAG